MRRLAGSSLLITLLLLATACARLPGFDRTRYAARIAEGSGLTRFLLESEPLRVLAYGRSATVPLLHLYLEGDGHAWARRNRLSRDPTPREPVALELAARDPHPAVAWLARPCQYTRERDPACEPRYWSSHRYAEAVVASLDRAIGLLKRKLGMSRARLLLIGYSGGGQVAALLAARRRDVAGLLTVAANLDHAAWTAYHGDTPLSGSLDAADEAPLLRGLPQRHLVGEEDEVVPPVIVRTFARRLGPEGMESVVLVPEFDHHCCWVRDWPELLRRYQPR